LAGNKLGKGFSLIRYIPGRPALKSGGVWQDSPIATGRQLASAVNANPVDALTLRIAYPSHLEIIQAYEDLEEMLENAMAYWITTYQQTPVYLQAMAVGESNRRYAVVKYATFDSYFDPYAQPYLTASTKVSSDEFTIALERDLWLELPPSEYQSIAIAHSGSTPAMAYDCIYDIIEDACENLDPHVMIGNMQTRGLQVIFRYTGTMSDNLLASSPPYALFGDPPATGDIVYFGSDQPFYGLATNFSELADPTNTLVYEYWSGAAWVTLTLDTSTGFNSFDNEGIGFIRWPLSSIAGWAKTDLNVDDVYFGVRVRVTAGGVGTTTYIQSSRHVYSLTYSYVDVLETAVLGQHNALLRSLIQIFRASAAMTGIDVWMGLRSYERGAAFVAHLNLGGNPTGNPAGITAGGSTASAYHANATGSNQPDPVSPGGGSISLTGTTGDTVGLICGLTFSGSIANQYFGRYRCFALVDSNDGDGLSKLRYATANIDGTATFVTGELKAIAASPTTYQLVDLGSILLPPTDTMLVTEEFYGFQIRIDGVISNTKVVTFHSVILIPSDEYFVNIYGDTVENDITSVLLDGIGYPKYKSRAFTMFGDPYITITGPLTVSGGEAPIIHAGTRQRYSFLFRDRTTNQASPALAASIKMYRCQRYLTLRGD
jgi:hypothetical protein